jgi:hypothetical protein
MDFLGDMEDADPYVRKIGKMILSSNSAMKVTFTSETLLECIGLDNNHWLALSDF